MIDSKSCCWHCLVDALSDLAWVVVSQQVICLLLVAFLALVVNCVLVVTFSHNYNAYSPTFKDIHYKYVRNYELHVLLIFLFNSFPQSASVHIFILYELIFHLI